MRWFRWKPCVVLGGTDGSKPWPPWRCMPTGRGGRGEGKEFGTGVICIECLKLQGAKVNARFAKKTEWTSLRTKMRISTIYIVAPLPVHVKKKTMKSKNPEQ